MVSFLAKCTLEGEVLGVIKICRTILNILQIALPIALIIWGTIDMGKAVIAGDEKKMKEAQKPFVKRIIAAVIAFLIPLIVTTIMGYVGSGEWRECWKAAANAESLKLNTSLDDE